jgi:hypothetical protein
MEVMARIRQTAVAAATLHQFENGMVLPNHNQLSQKGSLLPGIWKMN